MKQMIYKMINKYSLINLHNLKVAMKINTNKTINQYMEKEAMIYQTLSQDPKMVEFGIPQAYYFG